MRIYLVLVMLVLVPAAAVFDPVDVSTALGTAARGFFLVAPILFALGTVVGLLARRRS